MEKYHTRLWLICQYIDKKDMEKHEQAMTGLVSNLVNINESLEGSTHWSTDISTCRNRRPEDIHRL